MGKKLQYKEIYDYVKSKNCELLTKEFVSSRVKMLFRCQCGKEFETTWNSFKRRNKTMCNSCTEKRLNKKLGKRSYEEVKLIIESKGCRLLSNEYISYDDKLCIQCQCGNTFNTTLSKFIRRNKTCCNLCMSNKIGRKVEKLTYDEVKHYIESKGCFLISKEFINSSTKLQIRCKCGKVFEKTLNKFKNGQIRCNDCSGVVVLDYDKVKHFIEQDSKSGCKLISNSYKNISSKIEVQCKCGNIFTTTFANFKLENKRQCDLCTKKKLAESKKIGIDYVKKYVEEHSTSKLISKNYSTLKERLTFQCECGNIFLTSFYCFKRGKTQCNQCSPCSYMERMSRDFFKKHNIKYQEQFYFNDLISSYNNIPLKFDFAIFIDNKLTLLELDGEQHFKPCKRFGGVEKFNKLRFNDNRKNEYCKKNNIPLIRISYIYKKNLEQILTELFL